MTARDVVYISIILLVTALFLFIGNFLTNTVMDKALAHPVLNSSQGAVDAYNSVKTQANKLDYVYFAYFIGLFLGLMITGWLIGGNPIFMFFYVIILIFAVLISPILKQMLRQPLTKMRSGSPKIPLLRSGSKAIVMNAALSNIIWP